MGFTNFSTSSALNPHILSEKLYRQQWRAHPFLKFMASNFVRINEGPDVVQSNLPQPGEIKFTGAPIEVFTEFQKKGKTDMDIPVRNRLTAMPVHGDASLEGTGERATVAFRRVPINYTRKAYRPPTGMSLQIVKQYADAFVSDAYDYMRDWIGDYMPGNVIMAALAGYSRDLLLPAALGGRAKTIMSHPNFYVAGSGQVDPTYASGRPGSANYEASVATALDALAPGKGLTVQLVRNLKIEAIRKRIRPIALKNGYKFYTMWISDAQLVQLAADEEFKDLYKRLPEGMGSHPLLTGAIAEIDGVVLFADQDLFAAHTNAGTGDPVATAGRVTAGKVWYGPLPTTADKSLGIYTGNFISDRDTGALKLGILCGQSMMSMGQAVPQTQDGKFGSKIEFTDQVKDHGRDIEIGVSFVQSFVRSDVFDVDGLCGLTAGDFYENTSSLVVATYSPDEMAWA